MGLVISKLRVEVRTAADEIFRDMLESQPAVI